MNKKQKNQIIDRMPLDCWCNIVLYFHTPKDFFSLVFTVRSLYYYIQKISPQSTKCIEFSLNGKIPDVPLPHVSRLKCVPESEEKIVDVLGMNEAKMNSLTSFFSRILKHFNQLMKLNVDFLHHRCLQYYPNDQSSSFLELSIVDLEPNYNNFLVKLIIKKKCCEITIDHHFHKLEELFIDCGDDIMSMNQDHIPPLRINFAKLRKLCYIRLIYVSLKDSIEPLKDRLQRLDFFCVKTTLHTIAEFPKLRLLSFADSGVNLSGVIISNLESLNVLDLRITTKSLPIYKVITGYTNLKKLTLDTSSIRERFRVGSVCEVKHLPNLETLDVENRSNSCTFRVIGLPKLRSIHLGGPGRFFEIPEPKKNIPNLERIRVEGISDSRTAAFFIDNLDIWKKNLQSLKLLNLTEDDPNWEDNNITAELTIEDFPKLQTLLLCHRYILNLVNDCPSLLRLMCGYHVDLELRNLSSLQVLTMGILSGVEEQEWADNLYQWSIPRLESLTIVSRTEKTRLVVTEEFLSLSKALFVQQTDNGSFGLVQINGGDERKDIFDEVENQHQVTICLDHVDNVVESQGWNEGEKSFDEVKIIGVSCLVGLKVLVLGKKSLTVQNCPNLKTLETKLEVEVIEEVIIKDLPKLESFKMKGSGGVKNFDCENVNKSCKMEIEVNWNKKETSSDE